MWKLKNLMTVIDRQNSHLHGEISGLVKEALQQVDPADKDFLVQEVNMGRVVGQTTCVPTGAEDTIVYAQRLKRAGATRFVMDREPKDCDSIVVILKKASAWDEYDYVLIAAFIGKKAEPEPWDRNATPASRNFWDTHALVFGSEPVYQDTVTPVCPWDRV